MSRGLTGLLVISLAALLASCSDERRSHLYISICKQAYQVDETSGKDLANLIQQAAPGWESIQIDYAIDVPLDQLNAAVNTVHQSAKGSAVFIRRDETLDCQFAASIKNP